MHNPKFLIIAIIACISLVGIVGFGLSYLTNHPNLARQVSANNQSAEISCNGKRWGVKTLADKRASLVNLQPQATTVGDLANGPQFLVQKATARTAGYEDQVFSLQANLVEVKHSVDKDFQLVIADPTDPSITMIAELPDPACFNKKSGQPSSENIRLMAKARADFIAACGSFTKNRNYGLEGQVSITGVRFIDIPHKAKKGDRAGEAKDHVELHPLLSFSATSCKKTNTVPIPGARDHG